MSQPQRTQQWAPVISVAVIVLLSACTARQPTVVEELDEFTAASITYSQTPVVMSPDRVFAEPSERPYVDIGAIEVNHNRVRQYYLWLGIWDINDTKGTDKLEEFESIVLIADGQELPLDVHGWTHEVISSSKPVYKKLFAEAVDAYYQVSLEQVRLFAKADRIELRTTGSAPREFVPWYREKEAKSDLAEFLRRILE